MKHGAGGFYTGGFTSKSGLPVRHDTRPTERWACDCTITASDDTDSYTGAKMNPPYLVNCLDCGARRDDR